MSFIMLALNAWALPVVNESVGTNSIYTIYPDHEDRHLYYISPNFMTVAQDEEGIPLFAYTEYKSGWFKKYGVIQMVLRVQNYEDELKRAKDEILSADPQASFALVPFKESFMEFDNTFQGYVFEHSCSHMGGEYSAEQSCTLSLTDFGTRVFKNTIHKRLTMLLRFQYVIDAVERNADGTFSNSERRYQIAGRVGGDLLVEYPELFTDWRGNIIRF